MSRLGCGMPRADARDILMPGRSLRTLASSQPWLVSLRAARTLWCDYGHVRSARDGKCVDTLGNPIPWYTYPAIEYLKQLDFSEKAVFEFGAGQSTLFWAARARRVVSVEDDRAWYETIVRSLPSNCQLFLETDLYRYVERLSTSSCGFDVIVVDGAARGKTRLRCCEAAVPHLNAGGMIVLDNADWLPQSTALLRCSGLIEIDMTGFVPLSGHTQTTSFFLRRDFAFAPHGRQPQPGPGASIKNWERAAPAQPPVIEFGGETFGAVMRDQAIDKRAPSGTRHFRLLLCRATDERPAAAAILDVDRQRVLLTLNEPTQPTRDVDTELERIGAMSWAAFCAFINQHQKRRYEI